MDHQNHHHCLEKFSDSGTSSWTPLKTIWRHQRSITVIVQTESQFLVFTGIYRYKMIEYVNEHADSTQKSGMSSQTPLKTLQRHQGELIVLTKKRAYQDHRTHSENSQHFVHPKVAQCGGEGGSQTFFEVWNPYIFFTQGLM